MLRGKLSQLVLLAAYSDWEREGGEVKLELLKLFLGGRNGAFSTGIISQWDTFNSGEFSWGMD